MLEESFIFLPGVREKTERMLWREGIATWDHLLDATAVRGVSKARLSFWKSRLRETRQRLSDVRALRSMLGTRNAWRAHREVMSEPRFLDIETTEYCNEVTVVGISDGEFYQAFVRGRNLAAETLRKALLGATCIVTFNGSSFDLPIIERNFPGVLPDVPHLDLRHICAQAGLHGGLKHIERLLGIRRADAIRDSDGTDAILQWYRYVHGNPDALTELVDYNAADVLNLAPLLNLVVPALWSSVRHGKPLYLNSPERPI